MKFRFWLCLLTLTSVTLAFAELIQVAPVENSIRVLQSSETETLLHYTIGSINSSPVRIDGEIYYHMSIPSEGIAQEKGCPSLPVLSRSLIIPSSTGMKLEVSDLQYTDLPIRVAPSKGVISRDADPGTVAWDFGESYTQDSFYPSALASLSEPYILRDFRGITVKSAPLAYNHRTRTLRVYTSFKIRVYASGSDSRNQLKRSVLSINQSFLPVYQNHFLNYGTSRYVPVDESFGKLLVISTSNFLTDVNNYVNWKKQKGISTELVIFSTIGSTATELQSYIQARYTADPDIAYVQLIGDVNLIPTLFVSLRGSDPSFSLVAGSDSYPDIFIGRFSAQSQAQLTTQIQRTISYEKDLNTSATWLSKGMGIASAEGGGGIGDDGESDIEHMNIIRTKLLNYGYNSVDQIYDPGATSSQVKTAVNAGRGWISYAGLGSTSSWVTTGFTSADALDLNNDNKLPIIIDVASENGNFTGSTTCFAEAWMQSSHGTNGNPTGAIAIYASTIVQSWNAPMSAQDEVVDLMVQGTKSTVGGLFYNGACKMLDEYGTDGINMFKAWTIFGDASLMVRTKTPQAMTVSHPTHIQTGISTLYVSTNVPGARVSLTHNNIIYATGITNSLGETTLNIIGQPLEAFCYMLTVTAKDRVTYSSGVQQVMDNGPCMQVSNFIYRDLNNNVPDYNEIGFFNVTFKNIGAVAGSQILATLSTTSPGVTITDATELISTIAAGASILRASAFTVMIADGVIDGSIVQFTLSMTSGVNVWNHSFSISIHAPVFSLGTHTVSDLLGNNNGKLDPGETVTINIPLNNFGGAASQFGSCTFISQTPGLSSPPVNVPFSSLPQGSSIIISFELTAASDLPLGSIGLLEISAAAGSYSVGKTAVIEIGTPNVVTIGSGTATQTYPLDRYYNYSSHESIYLASEIGGSGIIQSLGFEKQGGADLNAINNVTIYMKHTTAISLTTGNYSLNGYTQVFSGTFPNHSSGWMEIELDNRFTYDGLSNLLILILKGNQAFTISYPLWKYSENPVNVSRQARSDGQQPTQLTPTRNRPNVRFNMFTLQNSPHATLSIQNGSIMIHWEAVPGAQNYKVLASTTPNGTFTSIGSTSQCWFSDPNLGSSQKYYKVIAYSAAN